MDTSPPPIVGGMAAPSSETSGAALRRRLDGLTIRDAAHFGRRLKNLRGAGPEKLQQLANQITKAEALVATRQAAVPTITYPDLPVSERRQEIADALRAHQVVVVAGETGSGKTTQLPKICLDIGRGIREPSGTPSPGGWLPAPSRSASPTNWVAPSATRSATPYGSPTRSATVPWSS